MELAIFNIIKRPLITSKSIDLYKKLNQYTFEVHTKANRVMVREAIEKIWNVKVEKVCVINCAEKIRTFKRKAYETSAQKKAIVTLKAGYKIDIPGLFEAVTTASATEGKAEEIKGS